MRNTTVYPVEQVASLLNIGHISGDRLLMPCPVCGSKRAFDISLPKQAGYCFKCNAKVANGVDLYAKVTGMEWEEALKELRSQLHNGHRPISIRREPEVNEGFLAPLDVRDRVYRRMLSHLPLAEDHFKNLQQRGLDGNPFGYRTYDIRSQEEAEALCFQIKHDDPEITMEGVPGFYKNQDGIWTMVTSLRGILVPYLSATGKIQGLQVRRDPDLLVTRPDGRKTPKYVWFSSRVIPAGCTDGTKCATFAHWAVDFYQQKDASGKMMLRPVIPSDGIYLTEGGMKADIFHALSGAPCIAVPGVNTLSGLKDALPVLKRAGVTTIVCAYDMDYLTNVNVKNAVRETKALVTSNGFKWIRMRWRTHNCLKGVDDLMAYKKKHILPPGKEYIEDFVDPVEPIDEEKED